MLLCLIILQLAALVSPSPKLPDAKFDLVDPAYTRVCPEAKAGEIIVCARRTDPDKYRLPSLPAITPPGPPVAAWNFGGDVQGGVGLSQRNVGGFPSSAVMATIKIPF